MHILIDDKKLVITAATVDPNLLTLHIKRDYSMQEVYELFEKNNLDTITVYNDDDTLHAVYTRYTEIESFFYKADTWKYVINLARKQPQSMEESVKEVTKRVDDLVETVSTMQSGDLTKQSEYALQALVSTFTDEQALHCILLFPEWGGNGISYKKDERIRYSNKLYKVLQDHTSQADWIPGESPSLYVEVADPAIEYPEFKKPTGAHDAYAKGDKVTYNGKKYISKIDGNTYTPDEYPDGWELAESQTKVKTISNRILSKLKRR